MTGTGHDRGAQPTLPGVRVRLRPWRPADAPAVYDACQDGVGALGYWTVAAHRGKGCTGEALRMLSGWVLGDLGARRVELTVDVIYALLGTDPRPLVGPPS